MAKSKPRKFKSPTTSFPKRIKAPSTRAPKVQTQENSLVEAIDQLAIFEEFKASLLPKLQEALLSGKPPKEILEMSRAYAAARIASMAALEQNPALALAASKDLLDRTEGKATERKELVHRLGKMRDEELDAMVLSALADGDDDGAEG